MPPSMRRIGWRLGTTRTDQPGTFAGPPSRHARISGPASPSRPSQNGHADGTSSDGPPSRGFCAMGCRAGSRSKSSRRLKGARSITTVRPVIGSRRISVVTVTAPPLLFGSPSRPECVPVVCELRRRDRGVHRDDVEAARRVVEAMIGDVLFGHRGQASLFLLRHGLDWIAESAIGLGLHFDKYYRAAV